MISPDVVTYYYPLCSRDFCFENIFSTESISPPCFYGQRGFGIDYFYQIPGLHRKDSIILYSEVPEYEVPSEAGDAIRFVVALSHKCINEEDLFMIDEGIVGYQNTIYLNKDNFKILFFSEREKKIVLLTAEASLPTKSTKKYACNFLVRQTENLRQFQTEKINSFDLPIERLEDKLQFDRKYNSFKGLVYGVIAGILRSKTPLEAAAKQSLHNVLNAFAEFKNRLFNSNVKSLNKSFKIRLVQESSAPVEGFRAKLEDAINQSETIFSNLFPEPVLNEADIINYLLKHFSDRFSSSAEAQKYVNSLFISENLLGESGYSKLKRLVLKDSEKATPIVLFERLKSTADELYKKAFSENQSFIDEANIIFKESLSSLLKACDNKVSELSDSKEINMNSFSYDFHNNQISISENFRNLHKDLIGEFVMIANAVLRNVKLGRGEAKQEAILLIVSEVDSIVSKKKVSKASLLYRYLNNEIDSYSLEKVSSFVHKNFISFVFNPDSIEKLDSFLDAKAIEEKWMATAFWGAFNGFSNLSGNFLKVIFDAEGTSLQANIDQYLASIVLNKFNETLANKRKDDLYKGSSNVADDKKLDFFKQFVEGKYELSYEAFVILIDYQDTDSIPKAIKSGIKIPKKDVKKLIDLYKSFIDPSKLF